MFQMALPSEVCQSKVDLILKERSNSNYIIDFIEYLMSENEKDIEMGIESLQKVFTVFMEREELTPKPTEQGKESVEKYKLWIHDQYLEFMSHLVALLSHSNRNVQVSSANTLGALLSKAYQEPNKKESGFSYETKVKEIVFICLNLEQDYRHVILAFCDPVLPPSFKLEILKSVYLNLRETKEKDKNSTYMMNVYSTLSINWLPRKSGDSPKCDSSEQKSLKIWFSKAWVEFLKYQIPFQIYKKILVDLHETVLPNMKNPVILTDFLTESYDFGGAISLLALNGIFFLIQNYNLEYPNFYEKLYALLSEDIFNAKYRARFFYLMDIFLSSTYLPGYLMGAFVKKLSRMALVAPPDALLIILPFIRNLIIRHPNLRILLNRSDIKEVTADPYMFEEMDLSKCRALDSSLWEIKSLQNHWHPHVSKEACFVNKSLPSMEKDLAETFETDFSELFNKEVERKANEVPLSFDEPKGLFIRSEDKMNLWWSL